MAQTAPFYQLSAKTLQGKDYDFSTLQGKVVLIVNTASACGFTPQYEGLQKLHEAHGDSGLVILGFPCNQFGAQESGDNDQIGTFCKANYGVSFQIMDKIDVNGDHTHPVYEYLKSQKSQLMMSRIKWNFEKFLVDKHGKVTDRYSSMSTPSDIESDIKKLLAA